MVDKERSDYMENIRKPRLITQLLAILAAVIFIILGIANGGMRDVLFKAINICTECIGLG